MGSFEPALMLRSMISSFADLNGKLLAARTDAAEKKTRGGLPRRGCRRQKVASVRCRLVPVEPSNRASWSLARETRGRLSSGRPICWRAIIAGIPQSSRSRPKTGYREAASLPRPQRMVETGQNEYALAKARESATEQAMREATGQGGLNSEDASGCGSWSERRR